MSEKTIVYTAPVAKEVLGDPLMFGKVVAMLHTGAQQECMRACEGRSYTVEHVRLVMGDNGPSFVRGLFDAEIRLTITVNEDESAYPQFPGAGAKVHICSPGTRHVEVARLRETDRVVEDWRDAIGPTFTMDCVDLTPHMRGDQVVYAGHHAPSDTWYYTDD